MKYGTIVKRRKIIMKKYAEVCSIKNMTFKSIVSFFTILAMVITALGIQPAKAVQADDNLVAGTYNALITPVQWHDEAPQQLNCIDISERVMIMVDGNRNDVV